jgi:hypothetical protein
VSDEEILAGIEAETERVMREALDQAIAQALADGIIVEVRPGVYMGSEFVDE